MCSPFVLFVIVPFTRLAFETALRIQVDVIHLKPCLVVLGHYVAFLIHPGRTRPLRSWTGKATESPSFRLSSKANSFPRGRGGVRVSVCNSRDLHVRFLANVWPLIRPDKISEQAENLSTCNVVSALPQG